MMTPQLTEQYGQVLRVSVVRAIFRPCVCAYTGARLKPNTVTPAPPINVVLMNVRLETSMASHSSTIKLEMGVEQRGERCNCGANLDSSIRLLNSTLSSYSRVRAPKDPGALR